MILLKIRESVPAIKVAMTQHWSLCFRQCCEMRTQSRVNLNTKRKSSTGRLCSLLFNFQDGEKALGYMSHKGFSHKRVRTQTWGFLVWAPNSKAPLRGEKLLFPANLPPSIFKKIHSELLSQLNEYTYRYAGETQNTHPGLLPTAMGC